MKIKFKLVNEQEIKIIGIKDDCEKEIGCIFTPSSSSENIINAIQVCGFSEAFDLWGCARYSQPELNPKRKFIDALIDTKQKNKQVKDIQLLFDFETEPDILDLDLMGCHACFNNPCTCENMGDKNPFEVKREEDLKERLEYD